MHVRFGRIALVFTLLFVVPFALVVADDKDENNDQKYEETIKVFKAAGESAKFFDKSYGYAVFPTVSKGAVGIGGAHGNGRVYEQGKHVGDTELSQVSLGLQLGGKTFSEIVFFEDKRALDEFKKGNVELGAEASVIMVTSGASAQTSTAGSSAGASESKEKATSTGGYYKGFAPFVVAKGGAMAGLSVAGQKFSYKPKG